VLSILDCLGSRRHHTPCDCHKPPPNEHLQPTLRVYLPGYKDSLLYLRVDHTPEHKEPGNRHLLDPIGAAHLLGAYYGVKLAFSVRLRPTRIPTTLHKHALPLKISVDMEGSLRFPNIAHAPKNASGRRYCDAWNALVGPTCSLPWVSRIIAERPISRFSTRFSNLLRHLSSTISSADVQPMALLPSLLPFQRRSVVWMLQREGKTLDEKGQVVPFVPDHRPLFWEDVEVGGQTMYLNRVREILSLEPPPPDVVHPGGSLNEAPGLGKTVECLALILLNPDIRRNPSVKRWDAAAKVHVREVHVS
jgi:hypothetical protein